MKNIIPIILILFLSCKEQTTEEYKDTIVFPEKDISFTKHMEPLFMQKCAISYCHTSGSPYTALDLTTPNAWNNLMYYQYGTLVVAKDTNCVLLQRLKGILPRMPKDRDPLNDNQLNGVKQWILEGAKYN